MITHWGLSNFKSFYAQTEVELAPLTVLTGTNSSGKSSFIQSMLLVAQTLRNPISSREIVINGPLVEMGWYDEIKSIDRDEVSISFTSNFLDIKFSDGSVWYGNVIDDKIGFDKIKYTITFDSTWEQISSLKLECFKCFDAITEYERFEKNGELIAKRTHVGKNLDIEKIDGIFLDELNSREQSNSASDKYDPQLIIDPHFLASNLKIRNSNLLVADGADGKYYPAVIPIQALLPLNKYLLRKFFGSFRYLGPLRFLDSIQPFSTADDPKDVGISGKFTAAVLHSFFGAEVKYVEACNKDAQPTEMPVFFNTYKKCCLMEALNYWLKYFDIGDGIELNRIRKGFELTVIPTDLNRKIEITHVGVGISQVLPVLVMCLLADRDSILVFEQPELHLHPKVQSQLADFFFSMALTGRQCIIETHSEYFIDRLRLHISRFLLNNNESLKKLTKIYYFKKGECGTKVMPIEIDQYAAYTEWPDGFFDERYNNSEEIRRAINKKILEEGDIDSELLDD